MSLPGNIASQLHALDRQLIDLLAERVTLCRRAVEEDEAAFDAATQAEMLGDWQEMADEKGLSVGATTVICKGIFKLCQAQEI